ncbi:MAG: glycosyltransferase [Planctomycetota bacterium]
MQNTARRNEEGDDKPSDDGSVSPAASSPFSIPHSPFPRRVLYVITDLETGGVPLHLFRLATYAQRRGLKVLVCCLAPPGPVSEMLSDVGVANTGLGAQGPWDYHVLERLAGRISDFRPDIVHALLFHANVACRIACLLCGFPTRRLICEIQTAEIERPWHLWVEHWTQRWCRAIVGNSPSVIEHLRMAGHIHPSRLRLIPGGVDPEPLAQISPLDRRALGITDDDPILLWVGRLDPIKGLDELIEAFARVARARPCHLVLVGDGAYRPQVERLIRRSGCAERMVMLGTRSDVPSLLKTAAMFVFPSRTEGMPNALLEAMAAGLPCVAADVPGCRDVIDDRVDGLLTKPGDAVHLAATILQVLANGALARRLGQAAAAKVQRSFRLDRCLKSYLELYSEVLSDP